MCTANASFPLLNELGAIERKAAANFVRNANATRSIRVESVEDDLDITWNKDVEHVCIKY